MLMYLSYLDSWSEQARLWIIAAGYDPSENRIEYTAEVPRPPPLSCKAVADIITSRQNNHDDDDGGPSPGGPRTPPPPRALAVRQSRHSTTSPAKPPAGPRSNQGTSKAAGRGSGLLSSHSSQALFMFAFLTLRMPNPANTGYYRGTPLNEVRLLYTCLLYTSPSPRD